MYRGLGVSLAGIGPFIGIRMSTYDYIITKLSKFANNEF